MINKLRKIWFDKSSYERKALLASVTVVMGDILMLILRLGGNLIMTRLLYPEAFGLMAIVTMVLIGLHLISDAGVINAVILYGKDKGRRFVDTAWTILVIRGFVVSILCACLALPIAMFYDNDKLYELIIVAGLTAIISGFSSPQVMLSQRDIEVGRLTVLDLTSYAISLFITIIWLLLIPTIWALVANALIYQFLRACLSYVILKPYKPKFVYDPESVSLIFNFGKWILVSSAITFFSLQGDKVIMAKWMTASELGIYSVAAGFALILDTALSAINGKVLLPVFSEIKKNGRDFFVKQHRRAKRLMLMLSVPILLFFGVFGAWLIEVLYDDRYSEAGWMLQLLALGGIFNTLAQSIGPVMLAYGDSKGHMNLQIIKVGLLGVCTYFGGKYLGVTGLLVGLVVSHVLFYPALFFAVRKYKINTTAIDVTFALGLIVFISAIWFFTGIPQGLKAIL